MPSSATGQSWLPGQRRGISGRPVEAVASAAASKGADELWLVTTNDNLDALRLYQRHGFQLSALHAGAVDSARMMKPTIPPLGRHGIPIHDELILARPLR
jgi:GNAT superfamily N-acetyltransferase